MQSLRQSRHLLSAVKAQVERDQDRARLRTLDPSDSKPGPTAAAPRDEDADPEKTAQDAEPHRRPSAESIPRPSVSSSSNSEASDGVSNTAQRVPTAGTQYTGRTALGHSLTGVHARDRRTHEGKGDKVFVVGWEGPDDPLNPRNWTVSSNWSCVFCASLNEDMQLLSAVEYLTLCPSSQASCQAAVIEQTTMGRHHPSPPPLPS